MTSLINEITDRIKSGQTTARAEVEKALQSARDNDELHALLEVFEDEALQRADEIDAKIKRGEKLGRLVGVPYVAKDNFLTKVGHTTAPCGVEAHQTPLWYCAYRGHSTPAFSVVHQCVNAAACGQCFDDTVGRNFVYYRESPAAIVLHQ